MQYLFISIFGLLNWLSFKTLKPCQYCLTALSDIGPCSLTTVLNKVATVH